MEYLQNRAPNVNPDNWTPYFPGTNVEHNLPPWFSMAMMVIMNLLLIPRFISEEYQPSCRTDIAASSLPGGKFYQACIRCRFLPGIVWHHFPGSTRRLISQQRKFTRLAKERWSIFLLLKSLLPAFSAHHHLLNLRSPILRRRWKQSLRICNSISLWKSFSQNSETTRQTILGGLSAWTISIGYHSGLERKFCRHSTQQSMTRFCPNFQCSSKGFPVRGWS